MKKIFDEFKEFINRGNVFDMAVGVVIATAFGKITNSLVNDVIMPLIGYICGGVDLSKLNITLAEAVINEAGEVEKEAVVIGIGLLLATIIDFIIVAFVIFMLIKAYNKAEEIKKEVAKKKEEIATAAAEETAQEPSEEIKLLTEIRDLLKK